MTTCKFFRRTCEDHIGNQFWFFRQKLLSLSVVYYSRNAGKLLVDDELVDFTRLYLNLIFGLYSFVIAFPHELEGAGKRHLASVFLDFKGELILECLFAGTKLTFANIAHCLNIKSVIKNRYRWEIQTIPADSIPESFSICTKSMIECRQISKENILSYHKYYKYTPMKTTPSSSGTLEYYLFAIKSLMAYSPSRISNILPYGFNST